MATRSKSEVAPSRSLSGLAVVLTTARTLCGLAALFVPIASVASDGTVDHLGGAILLLGVLPIALHFGNLTDFSQWLMALLLLFAVFFVVAASLLPVLFGEFAFRRGHVLVNRAKSYAASLLTVMSFAVLAHLFVRHPFGLTNGYDVLAGIVCITFVVYLLVVLPHLRGANR